MADNNFRVNVKNFLGIGEAKYKDRMIQLALTSPQKFYALREKVLENVIEKAIGDLYDTLYGVMTEGALMTGRNGAGAATYAGPGSAGGGVDGAAQFIPDMPRQEVNNFCLKAAKTMQEIVRSAVYQMLPDDFLDLAKARTAVKSSAQNIG
jgi:hypothetical protein